MYLAIDIGGTKTLVAALDDDGVITERVRFETPKAYSDFLKSLAENVANMSTKNFLACGVGVPGRLNRERSICIAFGNLPWENVPILKDLKKILDCPVVVENDANLAGLSEAMLLKARYNSVLFLTISTGIGTGVIYNQTIEPALLDAEGGHLLLEHNDKLEQWEDFAAGSAIVRRYGKQAKDITDEATWKHIARDLSVGLIDLLAVVQPEVVVLGGSVGNYFERFEKPLLGYLKQYEMPLVPIPPIMKAQRPDDAVLYGCYDVAKSLYGKTD
jgi:predicted NBD/HSP70 family sugar kinase